MPARRADPALSSLKLLRPVEAVKQQQTRRELEVRGVGLDWDAEPAELTGPALAEWRRLAGVFAELPTRFREGDRGLLVAYCLTWAVFLRASAELERTGLLVTGRSASDRQRKVRSPAMPVWTQAGTQLRHLASALGLSPDARSRLALAEDAPDDDSDNPFA